MAFLFLALVFSSFTTTTMYYNYGITCYAPTIPILSGRHSGLKCRAFEPLGMPLFVRAWWMLHGDFRRSALEISYDVVCVCVCVVSFLERLTHRNAPHHHSFGALIIWGYDKRYDDDFSRHVRSGDRAKWSTRSINICLRWWW